MGNKEGDKVEETKSNYFTVEDYCASVAKKVTSIVESVMDLRAENICKQRDIEVQLKETKTTKTIKTPHGVREEEEIRYLKMYPVEILDDVFGPGVIANAN